MVRVGSLSVRWVLMHHAEPWLLTVSSKQPSRPSSASERPPFLKNRHNIPFMRKRNSRERHRETEGPPSKKLAADLGKGVGAGAAEGSSLNTTVKDGEKEELVQQKENVDQGSGEKLQNLEKGEGAQTQPQEEGKEKVEQENDETENKEDKKRERRTKRTTMNHEKHKVACSSQTASGDDE